MPRVGAFQGITIYIYAKDHNPPHVHALYNGMEAQIAIATGAVLEGSLPGNRLRLAQDWVRENSEMLQAKWDELK